MHSVGVLCNVASKEEEEGLIQKTKAEINAARTPQPLALYSLLGTLCMDILIIVL